ncbi:MAG: MBL fold metallo-hydrolase [Acidobacteria bacterium]|nr:MBL fold metallo-hydrolase [Acidobacteriota bacterium]
MNPAPEPIPSGPFRLDGGAMFGVVPKSLWEKLYTVEKDNRIVLGLNPVLIRGENRIILVDAGTPESGKNLLNRLAKKGISPAEVSDLVFTHLHYDHCGGAFSLSGDGNIIPLFPNARVHVTRQELEDALNPDERTRHFYRTEIASYISRTGRAVLIEHPTFIEEDVELVPAPGHTLGHLAVWVYRDRQYLIPGDLIPTRHHLNVHYMTGFDENTRQNIQTKKKLLAKAATRPTVIFFYHGTSCISGTVYPDGKHFRIRK